MTDDILIAYGASAVPGVSSDVNIKNVADSLLVSEPEPDDGARVYWATGLGKSALVAQKFVGTLRSLGRSSNFIHPVDGLHGDVGAWRPGDALLAVSASGKTEEVIKLAHEARKRQLVVVSLTSITANALSVIASRNLYSIDPALDPYHIPSASFSTACAVADALAVRLAERIYVDHPGGEIGRQLRNS